MIVIYDYYIFICICCTTHCGSSIDGWFTLIVIVVSHIVVLQVVDSDSSVLPIAGRPATIK